MKKKLKREKKLETPRERLVIGVLFLFSAFCFVLIAYQKEGKLDYYDLFLPIIGFLNSLPYLMTYTKYKAYYNNVRQREIAQPVATGELKLDDNSDFFMDEIIKEDSEYDQEDKKWRYISGAIFILLLIVGLSLRPDFFTEMIHDGFKYNLPFAAAFIYIVIVAILTKVIMIHKDEESTRIRQIIATAVTSITWLIYVIFVFAKSDQNLLITFAILTTALVSALIVFHIWRKKEPKPEYVNELYDDRIGELEAVDEED